MYTNSSHVLHSKIFNGLLREWHCSNTEIGSHNLMYPLFIAEADDAKEEVSSLPGVHRIGIHKLKEYVEPSIRNGLKSVLLFGVLDKLPKDEFGTNADSSQNPVMKAIPLLKKWFPNLTIACDVCLCAYTFHGHCGIIGNDKYLDNEASCKRIAEVARSYALAGADIVAPSDMMDGRIGAIKSLLKEYKLLSRINVLSYSAKFQSCMYGPFRDVANSSPSYGDRSCYQLPCGSKGLAFSAVRRDVNEGCDMLMVKPSLLYLDIVKQTKDAYPEFPLFVYQVSGEYAMLYHAAANGVFNLLTAVKETLLAMRRAGADCIITYYTPMLLEDMVKKSTLVTLEH